MKRKCIKLKNLNIKQQKLIWIMASETTRTSLPYLTKYEYTEALGRRSLQISEGKPSTVKDTRDLSPMEIAVLEFESGKSPIKIVRSFNDGKTEEWNINEMEYLRD